MPALPVSLIEPRRAQFSGLLHAHPVMSPSHPLGCHRRRVPDPVVFNRVVAALVHGSGDERIATPGCADRTIRRRVREWADAGLAQALHAVVLAHDDRIIGLALDEVASAGCITTAPGKAARRSPLDRGQQGLKRSTLTDASGVPLYIVAKGPTGMTGRCWAGRWPAWNRSDHCRPPSPSIGAVATTAA